MWPLSSASSYQMGGVRQGGQCRRSCNNCDSSGCHLLSLSHVLHPVLIALLMLFLALTVPVLEKMK